MNFRIEKAKIEEAQQIADLIEEVYERMPQKEWYVPDNAEYTNAMLASRKGVVYKAVEEESGELAAILMALYPGICEENLGNEIGLSVNQMTEVVHMESAAVHPKYRGNGLQGKLMEIAEQEAVQRKKHYLMCTIHPSNSFSMNNALKLGYHVMDTKLKYGGKIRNILLKMV